jgi:hypothetical protein
VFGFAYMEETVPVWDTEDHEYNKFAVCRVSGAGMPCHAHCKIFSRSVLYRFLQSLYSSCDILMTSGHLILLILPEVHNDLLG